MGSTVHKSSFWHLQQSPFHWNTFIQGIGLNILFVILSGMIASLMFPPWKLWWCGWFALVPMLIALRRSEDYKHAGRLMILFGIVYSAFSMHWLTNVFHWQTIGIYLIIALPWALFGVAHSFLYRQLLKIKSRVFAIIIGILFTPVLYLATEWVRCEGWYFRFSWGQFGFTLADLPQSWQCYSVIGIYGVTFVIIMANVVLSEIVRASITLPRKIAYLSLSALFASGISFSLTLPVNDLQNRIIQQATISVGVVQLEGKTVRQYQKLTEKLAPTHPRLVVWPEYALNDYPLTNPSLLRELQETARKSGSILILGCKEILPDTAKVDPMRRRAMNLSEGALFGNAALVIAPDGQVLGTYHKMYPVQFFSDGVPGSKSPIFQTDIGKIGIAICYDMDYTPASRRMVANGAEVLVVPTMDALSWSALQHDEHTLIAHARAAEVGRWVVRATTSGVSEVISPLGLPTFSIPNGAAESAAGKITLLSNVTWYVRVGYLLPYLCLGLTILWIIISLLLAWRSKKHSIQVES
ncbi:MAG: nitrilase-related carbon-nitrogen hydrolase [bacterium]